MAFHPLPVVIPVILCGGAGSRLWPVSRSQYPKPFMKLPDGMSLLEKTYRRAAGLAGVFCVDKNPQLLTITQRDYYSLCCNTLELAKATSAFILEPTSRNTGPAVALAAHYVAKHFGPDALLLILPADHWIEENLAFELSVKKAIHLAQAPYHQLVTFGIVPDSAQTGFGYIHAGEPLEDGYRVNAFVEKPDLPTAQAYLNSGNYYWNSGIFCFSAGVLLQELATHAPDLAARTADCLRESKFLDAAHSSILSIDQRNFEPIPDISIDYALMEKSKRVAVVPASFAWSDIGSWSTIRNLVKPDTNHNRTLGEVIYFNASHNFVQSEHRVVTLVGAHDLIVIDTEDALLIANSENAQEVKSVVAQLKEQNHETVKSHRTTNRPWGTYTVLDEYPGYKVKRIMVNPGASLSLQIHHHRAEHWVVVRGSAQVTNGEEVMTLTPNQSTFIPAGQKHRLANLGPEPLEIIEVQSGTYLDEDDIVRFDDLYQRT